jgi:phosphoribosyl 1,2-cyclic phosphodiesterase
MIEVCSLSSGSNGNCFYIRTGTDSFLVDAGISCRQVCQRLRCIGSDIENISAIFITHEHSDHTRGLRVLLKRFHIPVYITGKTYFRSRLEIDESCFRFFEANDRISINGTSVQSLSKSHDAIDPILFCFFYKGKKISIVTDIGHACENVVAAVRDAHILFLETNYDDVMLWQGYYPYYLKQRISGNHGHLSNVHAAELIARHASSQLTHVFLSHLSENNNTPEIALETFSSILKEREDLKHLNTLLTSRHEVSPLVRMRSNE